MAFPLNQFLGRMGEAIKASGGYVDEVMGDGIMPTFGMDAPVSECATRALAAARAVSGVRDSLKQSLREELEVQRCSQPIAVCTGSRAAELPA